MKLVINRIEKHITAIKKLTENSKKIEEISEIILSSILKGNKIIFMGNGGSAADSQHLAAEFVGRFEGERKSLPALALTTDTSLLTAISNDYGFEFVFKRQIQGLANQGDVVVGISTSGNSKNILEGLKEAKIKKCKTIALVGKTGGIIKEIADLSIIVESDSTAIIQECHIFIGHTICEIVNDKIKELK